MVQKRRLLVNVAMSAVQVVVNGIVFFVLYRFLYTSMGAADVGVWSVVLASTSVSHIANLGMAGSAVKYVSMYLARDDEERVAGVVQTAVLTVGGAIAVVLVILYPVLRELLAFFIEPAEKIPDALSILPYALGSFWLSGLSGVLFSCIDGFHRVDLRNIAIMASGVLYLVLALVFVPEHGLIGLAWAQLLQAALLVGANWAILKRIMPALPVFPMRWSKPVFLEMLSYNLNFQAMSVALMLFDPVTNALLSKFAGVSASGYFYTANKLALQIRSVIVTAHSAIIPTIADLQEREPERIRAVYVKSFRLLLFLIVPSLPLLLLLTPALSELLVNSFEWMFVLFAALLLTGWFLNVFGSPAYFANMGTGRLRWNVWDHVLSTALNGILGVLLGWYYGGPGIVVGFTVALVAGSLLVTVMYHRSYSIRMAELVQSDTLHLTLAAALGFTVALLLYVYGRGAVNGPALSAGISAVYLAVIALPVWKHSIRGQIVDWLLVLGRRSSLAADR